jgi:hypothetical protein
VKSFLVEVSKFQKAAASGNTTQAAQELHGQVAMLHAFMTSAATGQASHKSRVDGQLEIQISQMRESIQTEVQLLGTYTRHHKEVETKVKAATSMRSAIGDLATTNVLLALDQQWWALRELLDVHLENTQAKNDAYKEAIDALQDYRQCKQTFEELPIVYRKSRLAKKAADKSWRETWRKSSNVLGQLAATVSDGDAFAKLAEQDLSDAGMPTCGERGHANAENATKVAEVFKKGLVGQTFDQVGSAFSSMNQILQEYETSAAPQVDLETIQKSALRILESYLLTIKRCGLEETP